MVWLPPAYKANGGGFSVVMIPMIYLIWENLTKKEDSTKYGTKEQYISAINALREKELDNCRYCTESTKLAVMKRTFPKKYKVDQTIDKTSFLNL